MKLKLLSKSKLFILHRIKQIAVISFAVSVILFASFNTSQAEMDFGGMSNDIAWIRYYTGQINGKTDKILEKLDSILSGVTNAAVYLLNLTHVDDSTSTTQIQESFTQLSNIIFNNTEVDAGLQNQLLSQLFGDKKLPNLNDLLYTNVLTPKSPTIVNYISHVGGLNIKHYTPDAFEFKNDTTKKNYASFYNSVMAISSFNAYVLSNMKNDDSLTEIQKKLLKEAGDSNWFKSIASTDSVGSVLRRLLMFQSQQFLFFNELMKTQKQMLYAQIMTNTLLMNYGRTNENNFIRESIK